MSPGKIAAAIEIIVSVWGSVKLAESLGEFRWENRIAKVLFHLSVLLRIGVGIVNLHWGKFSDGGLMIFSAYLLLVILVFYETDILKMITVQLLYWFSILMFQFACLFITAYVYSLSLRNYIYDTGSVVYPYYGVHLVGMSLEIAGICLLERLIKNKKILVNCGAWFYIGCMVIIICEFLIDFFVISEDVVLKRMDKYPLLLMLFLLWVLACMGCVIIAVFNYVQANYQRNHIEMNLKLLSEQYEFVVRSYEEKRRQVHDNVQHDIILLGMMESRQYEQAAAYLRDKTRRKGTGNRYTGLTTIDIMLDYKISAAGGYHIRFDINADLYGCPLKDGDMCVLLGNLLDNSVDAVKDLPEQERWVKIMLKSPNDLFMLEIANPYEGVRKKKQGHYLTTKKENSQMHGIGLGSVEKIVSNYDGDIEISDAGRIFKVVITIF